MTVLDLITRSLRLLGAINPGDPPTAAESSAALVALNALVDSWGTQRLTMYTTARMVQNVSANVQQYLVGPAVSGTDWTMARPAYLDAAGIIISGGVERELHVVRTDEEWARVRIKALTSTLPTSIYYEPDYPNGTAVLWPAPSAALQVALYVPQAVAKFATLAQTISLPPGYERALAYNLAVDMAPEFDRDPSSVVVAIAVDSFATVKAKNLPVSLGRRRADREFCGSGSAGRWDYMIGESR